MENNETLEEAIKRLVKLNRQDAFREGAKWQAERMYSEEEVEIIIQKLMMDVHCGDLCYGDNVIDFKLSPRQWFEQFKKK
jgi:hypothetical protein